MPCGRLLLTLNPFAQESPFGSADSSICLLICLLIYGVVSESSPGKGSSHVGCLASRHQPDPGPPGQHGPGHRVWLSRGAGVGDLRLGCPERGAGTAPVPGTSFPGAGTMEDGPRSLVPKALGLEFLFSVLLQVRPEVLLTPIHRALA